MAMATEFDDITDVGSSRDAVLRSAEKKTVILIIFFLPGLGHDF